MKRYDEKVLQVLLDKYEGSVLYTGKNQVHVSISYPIHKKTLPEYFDETSTSYDVIHEQLEELERKGFIQLSWKNGKKGHILDKCILVPERADEIYQFLHRKTKAEKMEKVLEISKRYLEESKTLNGFCTWMIECVQSGGSVKRYVDLEETDALEQLCMLISCIEHNEEECFLRTFSTQFFHDSKIAEKEIDKAASVIRDFGPEKDLRTMETEAILEEYNIFRNPSWVMLRGKGTFRIENQAVELKNLEGGIGLSNQDIRRVCWEKDDAPEYVLTIENLTSFHQWNRDEEAGGTGTLCVYLGGYANRIKREFLRGIYRAYPNAGYYHFGDMDCGGFQIWKDLCLKTGIPFRTWKMDSDTFQEYRNYGRSLSEHDKKRLSVMLQDVFFEDQRDLFEMMLQADRKLEQEVIR